MLRTATVLAAVTVALLSCGLLFADCPAPVRVVRHAPVYYPPTYSAPYVAPYVAPVVVKKVVVEEVPVVVRYQAVIPLVSFGSYSAVYAPPPQVQQQTAPQAQQTAPASSDMSRIAAALESLERRLDRLERGQQPAPKQEQAPAPKQTSAQSVIQAKCASCHGKDSAAEKGAGLVLYADGAIAQITPRQANKVIGRSYAGAMPPKDSGIAPLSDAEVATIVQHFGK